MFNFAVGFVAASVIFVFYPPLAAIIATGVRNSWNCIKSKFSASREPQE